MVLCAQKVIVMHTVRVCVVLCASVPNPPTSTFWLWLVKGHLGRWGASDATIWLTVCLMTSPMI